MRSFHSLSILYTKIMTNQLSTIKFPEILSLFSLYFQPDMLWFMDSSPYWKELQTKDSIPKNINHYIL